MIAMKGLFILGVTCACWMLQAKDVHQAPSHLTVEYLNAPIGLDTPAPRLSWIVPAGQRYGVEQTAYQIRVASDPALLTSGADLWDSGKVLSDQSVNVTYNGKPLQSSQRCWWSVRIWTNQGEEPSHWSAPERWIMGILRRDDWKARWIGANSALRRPYDMNGASWIYTGESALAEMPQGDRFYRKVFTAAPSAQTAILAIAADDTYEVKLNGILVSKMYGHINDWRFMRFLDVTDQLRNGANILSVRVQNKEKGPTALLLSIRQGNKTLIQSDSSWTAAAKAPKGWETAPSAPAGFAPVRVVGKMGCAPWGELQRTVESASPAFEKSFTVNGALREATLHITGVGFYEASLNGVKIGNKVLDPIPTRYDRRVLYSTYDVSKMIKEGKNNLHVLVGHGWYDVRSVSVWNFDHAPWRDFPRMIAQLELTYEDGSSQKILSDASWRQVPSPLSFDCIREGEISGLSLQPETERLQKEIVRAEIVPAPKGILSAEALPPTVIQHQLQPKTIRSPRPGVWVVDFGQNMAGWMRMKINGQNRGDVIKIEYAERLDKQGLITLKGDRSWTGIGAHYRHSGAIFALRTGGFQTDHYVCHGGEEQYEPRFTYHGFQYVQISGLKKAPTLDQLVGCVVQTDFKPAGEFSCSNPLINQLQQATLWAYRGNFVNGYPTDCPHREKNGWTGDASLASELGMYNFQNVAAYEKWIQDLIDEQQENGNLPGIVPTSGWGYQWGNGPAWDSALVIIPWMLYTYKGDVRILEKAYPAMAKYVDYMKSRAKEGTVSHGLGDWIPVKTVTPTVVTSTGYYFLDAKITAQTAALLGKTDEASKYAAIAEEARAGFNKLLYKGNGVYSIGSQTAQSCALHQGFVPASERKLVEQKLIETVLAKNGHPDFGILGSKYLFRALSEAGRSDLALQMLEKTEYPSFGYWIKQGATTLWEDWTEGSSRNHIMFGDFSAWLYQYPGGIRLDASVSAIAEKVPDPAAVGMKRFLLAPEILGDLTYVKATHNSPYGTIISDWKRSGENAILWTIQIPANTRATVLIPEGYRLTVNPKEAKPLSGYPRQAFSMGSGRYNLQCTKK